MSDQKVYRLRLGTPENAAPVRLFGAGEAAPFNEGAASLPFSRREVQSRAAARGFVVELPMRNDEDIYGFGLQFHSLNHAGRRRFLKVNSDPVCDTGETHAPVPFYVSTAGYGLFVDTFRCATFYLGTNGERGSSKETAEPEQERKEFSEEALYALKRARNKRSVIIEIPHCAGVDLYFFEGPRLLDAVSRYNRFSGGGCLPPRWALGAWYRMYGGADQEAVLRLAEQFRRDKMPFDVIGLEPGWHSHRYSCSFTWDAALFPRPDELVERLKAQGYAVNLWEHAFVHPSSPLYETLEKHSGNYEVWGGLVPDLADSAARERFAAYHARAFVDAGVAGFKLDECDSSDFNPSNWSFPDCASFPSGLDGEQMHSAFGLLYQKTIEAAFAARGARTFGLARSSWALASPSPFALYSDLYEHRQFVRALVNAGFCGLLWAPEVRSCVSSEDFIRRLQTAVFSPLTLLNCWRIPNPPWFQTDTADNLAGIRMADSDTVTRITRQYLELRAALVPYLSAAFQRYHDEGVPPMRALALDYQEDERARAIDDEYLFGPDLLAAPVFAGEAGREVYLPQGEWRDFWTGAPVEGGRSFFVTAPLDRIPVYVKNESTVSKCFDFKRFWGYTICI